VRSLAEALGAVSHVPVCRHVRVRGDLAVGEFFQRAGIVVVRVSEAHPSVGLRRD
jgi:hypothetical protein